jgi:transposase
MMGHRTKRFKLFAETNLDALLPADNFYRRLEERLDLSFVRDLVRDCYEEMGRPSIDPVVFFKLQLIAFFEGITSERHLMETAHLNLAHRWYLGYDFDEPLPDHSSLSKIRSRYGVEAFHRFFERIVELCIEAGLVEGEELYLDATKVDANASIHRLRTRLSVVAAKEHVAQVFAENPVQEQASVSADELESGELVSGGAAGPIPEEAERSDLRPFRRTAATLRRWQQEVLNYWRYPLTNALVEGKHNRIKALKRRGYGYRNNRSFLLRILSLIHTD